MEEFNGQRMSRFNDSFSLMFGIVNDEIDLFDNRYVDLRVNEMS